MKNPKIKYTRLTQQHTESIRSHLDIILEHVLCEDWKIPNHSEIAADLLEELAMYQTEFDTKIAFKPIAKDEEFSFNVQCTCDVCNKTKYVILDNVELYDCIVHRGYICDECINIFEREQAEEEKIEQEEKYQDAIENTKYYINNYLSPKKIWSNSISFSDRFNAISQGNYLWDYIHNTIKNMPYKDFLSTPYWKSVTYEAKRRVGFKCQLCNSGRNLATHHRTYEHHGREHEDDIMQSDLIVLCETCHSKFHDKLKD